MHNGPEEVVERALEVLNAEEDWLAENRGEIGVKIQEGWEQAKGGEFLDAEEVSASMQKHKQDWLKLKVT